MLLCDKDQGSFKFYQKKNYFFFPELVFCLYILSLIQLVEDIFSWILSQ